MLSAIDTDGVEDGFVVGEASGLAIPAHPEALAAAGPAFLTRAFQDFGSLPPDNRVARIANIEPCMIGSTGQKLFLTVEYEHPSPSLATELFVKFSRHFSDWFHDRRRFELESEVHFYRLASKPGFPISVPKACFGDFDPASGTGVLITERIAFDTGRIEPLCAKCMDHELRAPLDHYRAIVTALARLAGAHHAGRLSPEVDRFFPFDAEAVAREDPIERTEEELRTLVAHYARFAEVCPRLLPERVRSTEFIKRLERNVLAIARHQQAIKRFLHADPRFVALTHFNPNIDNAWFWRDDAGVLQCGLFDWQRARQMNVAYALWGGLCGGGLEIWTDHLDELLVLFVDEFQANGGPKLPVATLTLHLHLYAATIGIAGLLEAPAVIHSRLPGVEQVSGLLDPVLLGNEGARCFLHVFTAFLNFWDMHGFSSELETILEEITGEPPGVGEGGPSR